jgi:diguanylate cyclase (GGDEF)-like protein
MTTWDRRVTAAGGRLEQPTEGGSDERGPDMPDDLHPDDRAAVDALLALAATRPGGFSTTVLARRTRPGVAPLVHLRVQGDVDGPHVIAHDVATDALAMRDALTGLPARALVRERLLHALSDAERDDLHVAVLHIDIDGFRLLNSAVGYATGDQVLRWVSARLGDALRPADTLGRLGNDRFLVVAPGVRSRVEAAELGERLRRTVAERDDGPVREVGVSVGITWGTAADDPDTLLAQAELALDVAKEAGRDRCQFFDDALGSRRARRVAIDTELRRGIDDGTLEVHFQPIVDVRTLEVVGAEALMRVRSGDGAVLAPRELLDAANESGLLRRVEAATMQAACRTATTWLRTDRPVTVSINLTERQFRDEQLLHVVEDALASTDLPPNRLMLEIPETTLVADLDTARRVIEPLRRIGVLVAVDEFLGSDQLTARIGSLGVNLVKLDRGLVHAHDTTWGRPILTSIIRAMDEVHVPVAAMAVETEEQLAAMRELGCRFAQGYLFMKAVPASAIPMVLGKLHAV